MLPEIFATMKIINTTITPQSFLSSFVLLFVCNYISLYIDNSPPVINGWVNNLSLQNSWKFNTQLLRAPLSWLEHTTDFLMSCALFPVYVIPISFSISSSCLFFQTFSSILSLQFSDCSQKWTPRAPHIGYRLKNETKLFKCCRKRKPGATY